MNKLNTNSMISNGRRRDPIAMITPSIIMGTIIGTTMPDKVVIG